MPLQLTKSDDKTDEICLLYEWAFITETAALGAAILASLGCGEIKNMDQIDHICKPEYNIYPIFLSAFILANFGLRFKQKGKLMG